MLLCFVSGVYAQEWPRFRGPNGSGVGLAADLPARWTERDAVWRAELPGSGHSSPVLWGNRLFVTSADAGSGQLTLSCLNASDGFILWRQEFPFSTYTLHANNNFAAATPAADAQHVYVPHLFNGDLILEASTHEGAPAWKFDAGSFKTEHGLGHSPVVVGDLVILVDDQDLPGNVFALDTKTGRLAWKSPRNPGRADYSTPCVLNSGGEPCLILNSHEDGVCALRLRDGSLAWSSAAALDKRSVSSPTLAAGLVIASCGSGGGGNYVIALRPPSSSAPQPATAYQVRRAAPYVPSALALGDLLFLWSDGGIVTCLEAATGTQFWQERVGGNYFSSPVSADGKIYNTSTSGEVVVLAASKEFRELGRSQLGEATHATAAIANGRIYFRTLRHVIAIGPR